jgi:hypothetical protein
VTSVALAAAEAVRPAPDAREALEPLRDLPGLLHGCLLDEGGRVLAEVGTDEGTAAAVLAWGRRAGGVASDRGLALEDVIVTSDVGHHLLRAVHGTPFHGSWVYLRVDRDRGNLALARRRLAAVAAPSAHPATTPVAPRSPSRPQSGPTPLPATTPALPAAAAPAAAPPAVPAHAPAAAPTPTRPVRAAPTMAGTFPRRVPDRSSPVPAASMAAPIAAMATPPAPAVLPEPRRPTGTAPTTRPSRPVPPADVEHRRSPPQDSAGVLAQRWRTDPETLRRVLAGLLRLGRGSPQVGAPPPGPPPALPGR